MASAPGSRADAQWMGDSARPRETAAENGGGAAAWWALDVSATRALIAAPGEREEPPGGTEAVLQSVRIADVNPLSVYIIGVYLGRERMLGRPVAEFWPREAQGALAQLIVSALARPCGGAPETRRITSLAFVDPVLTVWTDESTGPDIVHAAISGIPAEDRSLWALKASEQRYRNLIHHLPTALLQIDSTRMLPIFAELRRKGIGDIAAYLAATPELAIHSRDIVSVTDANMKAVQLFGGESPGQLIGSVDYLFAAAPETAQRVIAAHFEGRRSHAEITKLRTFDGRLRDVELSVTYPTPPERLEVTLISLEDITDRLRTEAQLRQLQADYSRAARISMLGELATSIAHEVNQPLSAIVTNAETSLRWLAREQPNLGKVGQLTGRIADSARHASDIVQRIRGMAAKGAPERVQLDLSEIVDEALLFLRHEIETHAIELRPRLDRALPALRGDRVQLQQVIVNLVLNAVQALTHGGPSPGRIALSTAPGTANTVVFTVRDNGPGVADAYLDRVFDSFFTTKDDGMGMGLAICQSIIAAHGGSIAVTNPAGGGALFEVTLPTAGEP